MFKNWFLRIFILLLLITFTRSAFAATATESTDTFLKLSITHAMYTAVIADHFENQFVEYNPVGLADRIFFMTFLTEWKEQIETRKYNTTKDIFSALIKDDTYLRKFYKLWYSIHSPKKDYKNLYAKNWFKLTSVSAIYNMEFNELDPVVYTEKLLKFTSYHLITQNKQFKLALLIKEAFGSSKINSIKHFANSLQSNIEFKKFADKTSMAFNIGTLFLGGAKFFKLPEILKNILSNFSNKIPKFNIPRSLHSGNLSFQKVGKSGKDFFIKHNPFTKISMTKAVTISAVAHAAIAASFSKNESDKKDNTNTDPKNSETSKKIEHVNNLASLIQSFSNFYDLILHSYPIMTGTEYKDFTPKFELKSKDWIVKTGKQILLNQNHDDTLFSEILLQAEKQLGVDERKLNDHLASDFIHNKYAELAKEVENIFANTPEDRIIESIRELLIKGPLKSYMRDNPSITSTLLDWGGNCVPRTALFISLLKPYADRLPEGQRLGIYIEPKHIEPVIFNDNRIEHLMAGKKLPAKNIALYHPNYLVHLLLRNFIPYSKIPVNTEDLIIFDNRIKKTMSKKLNNIASVAITKTQKAKRQKGALDTSIIKDVVNGKDYGNGKYNIEPDIPERALTNYRPSRSGTNDTNTSGSPVINFKENLTPTHPLTANNTRSKNAAIDFKFVLINSTPRSNVSGSQQDPNLDNDTNNIQPSPHLPLSIQGFGYNQNYYFTNATVETYNDSIYLELSLLNLKKGSSSTEKLQQLKQILFRELDSSGLLSSDLNKYQYEFMLDAISSCTRISCITQDYDMQLDALIEIAEQIVIIEKQIQDSTGNTNPNQSTGDPLTLQTTEYLNKLSTHASTMIAQRLELIQYFTTHPRDFLIYFNSLPDYQRVHLLNFLNSSRSNGFTDTLYNGKSYSSFIIKFKETIGVYLFRLDKVIVIPGSEMNTTIINVPVMSKHSSTRLGWKQESTWSSKYISKTDEDNEVLSNSYSNDTNTMNRLQLHESTLIEASILFQYGHQLWTPGMIETYKYGNFEHYYLNDQEIHILMNKGLNNYFLENFEIVDLIRSQIN